MKALRFRLAAAWKSRRYEAARRKWAAVNGNPLVRWKGVRG